MPKLQRSIMLPDGLDRLVKVLEEHHGATFTRILTAALLHDLFSGYFDGERGLRRRDPVWRRLATLLDRGELTVDDIPGELLESGLRTCKGMTRGEDPTPATVELLARFEEKKFAFDNAVEDCGGKTEAIVHFLTE